MTTTREAALEAALKLARNRLQACAIDHPTGSREMYERSEWADEATAALSTPATEPQGLVENDTIDSFCLTLRRLVSDAYAERDRFGHIAATIRINALHYGATNAEVEAMLSGEISFVNWIADKVEARPDPQPAADTRVIGPQCCMCGKLDLSTVEDDGGAECELHDGRWVCSSDCYDRAIIGTAQSDKIAEAALIEWLHGETLDIVTGEPLFDGAHIDVTAGEVRRRLAALAGKGAK